MARTQLTAQKLQTPGGQAITFATADTANGEQVRNTGIQVVIVKTAAGGGVTVTFPSQPDQNNREGDLTKVLGASVEEAFGPFVNPLIWGDGSTQLYIDYASATGSVQVAVISI